MSKNIKILIFFLVLVLALIIFADSNKTKPIDWRATYGINDKIPLGLKVFNEEANTLFKNQNLEKFSETPYEFFYDSIINENIYSDANTYEEEVAPVEEIAPVVVDSFAVNEVVDTVSYDSDTEYYENADTTFTAPAIQTEARNSKKGTIFSVTDQYQFDDASTQQLLFFAKEGNTIFISAKSFPKALKDSLQFDIKEREAYNTKFYSSTVSQKTPYHFEIFPSELYFNKFNKSNTKILGNLHEGKYILPNFIEIKHGNGKFILHLQPIAFTNLYLLKDNFKYTESVCSYIDTKNIYWNVEGIEGDSISDSPLRFIFSQPALKWAWYLSLLSIILFMFFNAKRRQRIIPIKEPIKNTTIEFAKTIGNLYFLEKNHHDIAHKKIVFFLEKIRKDYYLDTTVLDETFVNRLQQKTSKDKTEIIKVINKINYIKNSSITSEKDLIELNTLIEKLNL